jgi:hypothetical protein
VSRQEWIEAAEEYARHNATTRQCYLPDAEARKLLGGLLTKNDLDAFRTSVRRWHILEKVRRFVEPDIREQAVVAIFAFPDRE